MTSANTLLKTILITAALSLTACGGGADSTGNPSGDGENNIAAQDGIISSVDADVLRAEVVASSEQNLPIELKQAAVQPGDLACGLPLLPDHRDGEVTDGSKNVAFNTDATPVEVAAFYAIAAAAKQGEASTDGTQSRSETVVALPDMRRCKIVAKNQSTGATNVTVRFGA